MSKLKLKTLREKCLDCSCGVVSEVRLCEHHSCPLYVFRMGRRSKEAGLQPLQAARKYCLECCNGSMKEVSLCPAKQCPLWLFRSGHNPK